MYTRPAGSLTAPLLALLLLVPAPAAGQQTDVTEATPRADRLDITIEEGSGSFLIGGGEPYPEKHIRVFYHRPESFTRRSPVVLVIPGAGRDGDEYRDAWVEASERHGALILSPSYAERYYPEYWSYNLAGMARSVTLDLSFHIDTGPEEWTLDRVQEEVEAEVGGHGFVGHSGDARFLYQLVLLARSGMLEDIDVAGTDLDVETDPERWIFDDFDRIFHRVAAELELETEEYDLFGHSAGGQILHRFALFHPDNSAGRILAANSGWYTLPTREEEFPYGLEDTGRSRQELEAAFGNELVVFLGEEDDEDETRGSLRTTPAANRQGGHRLARGRYFFQKAREAADRLGVEMGWTLEIVSGVGHDYERMSEAAADYLYGEGPG